MPSPNILQTRLQWLRHFAALALPVLLAATPATAQVPLDEVPVLSKPAGVAKDNETTTPGAPASTRKTTGRPSTSAYWYDGSRKRLLTIDPAQVADFGNGALAGAAPEITAAGTLATKAKPEQHVSPLLRDASTGKLAGALPGGVLVRLNRAVDQQQADALAAAFGAHVDHPVGAPESGGYLLWLFTAPAGLASLELANRIHESGQVHSAAPNWWKPRALK